MSILLDVSVCIVVFVFAIIGFKQGLVVSLVQFVGHVAALIAAIMLSNVVAEWICGKDAVDPLKFAGIQIVVTLLLFIALQLVVRLLANALKMVFHLPILRQVDALLGIVFGFLQGIVVLMLLCSLLALSRPYLEEKGIPLTDEQIGSSILFKQAYENNPVFLLFHEAEKSI